MEINYCYYATILEVVDGDTFIASVDLGLEISKICRIRVFDLDTPEKFCKHGDAQEKELGTICKEYAAKILTNKKVVIHTMKNKEDKLYDSFGRLLADVYIDDISWAESLSSLGVNKLKDNYSVENVYNLKTKYLTNE